MNMRTITIALAIAFAFVLAIIVILMTGGRAKAEVAPAFRSNYGWYWGSAPCEECRRNYEYRRRQRARELRRQEEYREHHRHTRKVWRDDRDHRAYEIERDDDHHGRYGHVKCEHRLSVVGDQYASEDGAQKEADKAWMQTARWAHGERMMSREHAKDATYECGRSSVGSVVGQVFYRCRLSARPCGAPKTRAN